MSRLPDQLKSIPFDGFYRMKKSVDRINPATTSEDGKIVVLYDRAFENPFFSTSRVVTHELGHVIYQNLSANERRDYGLAMKWPKLADISHPRPGEFISSRSKDSVEEDFAENIDAFLFEPARLKKVVPEAYTWITKKIFGQISSEGRMRR